MNEDLKRLKLEVMMRISHPESYYQRSLKSIGVDFRSLSHAEISLHKASMLSVEADAILMMWDTLPKDNMDNELQSLVDKMQEAKSKKLASLTQLKAVSYINYLTKINNVKINNVTLENPAVKFFEWSSDNKCLKYWDKSKGEKGEQVLVKLPFTFLVLDSFHSVNGYYEKGSTGIWSNEVRDLKKQVLKVRGKDLEIATGLYENIKPEIEKYNGGYMSSTYIAFKDGEDFAIGNIKFSGAALGAWFEFKKKAKVMDVACVFDSYSEEKKGKNTYYVPVFKAKDVSKETNEKAIELDKILQEYITKYFARAGQTESDSTSRSDVDDAGLPPEQPTEIEGKTFNELPQDDLPF